MKHYRVKKDTFMWKEGAIISDQNMGQYVAIEDIWDSVPVVEKEYISCRIIEHSNNAETFERVYPDTLRGKIYRTKDQVAGIYAKAFN